MKLRLLPLLVSLFIGLLFLFGAYQLQKETFTDWQLQERNYAEKRVQESAADLSQAVNIRLNLTSSLAAFVTINRDFTAQQFERFALILQDKMIGIRSLQLAPKGIVSYITNPEHNREALGHNLFADEKRRPMVEKSVAEKTYIIAGPINLIQGGQAIIARRPLFFRDADNIESFWGFATVLIDLPPLVEDAHFLDLKKDFFIALRGKDGLGAMGEVFYGDPDTFNNPIAIADVILPDAYWQLAVTQKFQQLPNSFIYSKWFWIFSIIAAFLLAVISYLIFNQPSVLKERIFLATENLRATLDSIGDGVIATDNDSKIIRLNPIAEKLTGWSYEEAYGKTLDEVFCIINASSRELIESPVTKVLATGQMRELASNTILLNRNGLEYHIADSAAPIFSNEKKIIGIILIFRDITDEIELQAQSNQRDKMDAIGQLAGGIAHDFNNMLTAIMGAAQLLNFSVRNLDEKGKKYIAMIIDSSNKAAALTNKLLAFSHKGALNSSPVNIDIYKIIDDTLAILNQTLDKRIIIKNNKYAENHFVSGNSSSLENALLNLGINASHAMEDGGEIIITTKNIHLQQSFCDHSPFTITPGEYIHIEFLDTGLGIQQKNIEKIFEPFFTTKEKGKGTGLGLSAVYAAIQEHQGAITVNSKVGVGTVFHLYLPYTKNSNDTELMSKQLLKGEGQLILVVDDEQSIRITTKNMLEDLGFRVLVVENGKTAVSVFEQHHAEISLVIMDMIMPEMDGHEAFIKMKAIDKNCRIIIASGFADQDKLNNLKELGLFSYLKKPYSNQQLNNAVSAALMSGSDTGGS